MDEDRRWHALEDGAIEGGGDEGGLSGVPRHVPHHVVVVLQLVHQIATHHVCQQPPDTTQSRPCDRIASQADSPLPQLVTAQPTTQP